MFRRKSKLIRELREEIQRLREALANAIGARDAYREQAREAIGLASEKEFPPAAGFSGTPVSKWADALNDVGKTVDDPRFAVYLPDPDPFSVKHCPECNVSVRSDSWPMECPACSCVFGFTESA